jgi:hypothetical protein
MAITRVPAPDRDIARARMLARVLDHYLVDPLIGLLLPVIGDALGALIGLYIVGVAARRRISRVVLARMVMNLTIDALIGAIPLIGDAYDFNFQANIRNVALLEQRSASGGRAARGDWLIVLGALLGFLTMLGLVVWVIVALVHAL